MIERRYKLPAEAYRTPIFQNLEDKTMRELTMNEIQEVNGGDIGTGVAFIGLGVAIIGSTTIAGLTVGAAFLAAPVAAAGALVLAGTGGLMIGSGISNKERC